MSEERKKTKIKLRKIAGKLEVRTQDGELLGIYDPKTQITYGPQGEEIATGNMFAELFEQER